MTSLRRQNRLHYKKDVVLCANSLHNWAHRLGLVCKIADYSTEQVKRLVTNHSSYPAVIWADPVRAQAFDSWLTQLQERFALRLESLRPASADASFRRYLRIDSFLDTHRTFIIMDAPPEHEDCSPFVTVERLMHEAGLRVPEIFDWDAPHGFLLLSDLGSQTLLEAYQASSDMALAGRLLRQAAGDILVRWQLASKPDVLPAFDETYMRRDLNLLPQWYISQYRGIALDAKQQDTLARSFDLIVARALATPTVFIHRDYMPRNLMVGSTQPDGQMPELGVLDFQDAVYGPITYDIASLMRDAFHSWEEEMVLDITIHYWEAARKANLPVSSDFSDFWIDVEWMGLQRHLKILGNFARLTLRDGKPKYLADTPRFINYIRATCARYRELTPLLHLIDQIEGITPQFGYTLR